MTDRLLFGADAKSSVRRRLVRALGSFLLVLASACGPISAEERGAELLRDPALSSSPSNVFSCATCHAVSASDPPLTRPGFSLVGAAQRPTLWAGAHGYLLDAVNQCLVDFMRGERLTPDDPRGLALLAALRSQSDPSAGPTGPTALPCTVVRNIDATYLGSLPAGDATRGTAAYQRSCAYCHGAPRTGEGRLGPRVSILPDDTLGTFGAEARSILIEKVRHGKYFSIGGVMPFYCTEALSDADLADITAHLLP